MRGGRIKPGRCRFLGERTWLTGMHVKVGTTSGSYGRRFYNRGFVKQNANLGKRSWASTLSCKDQRALIQKESVGSDRILEEGEKTFPKRAGCRKE